MGTGRTPPYLEFQVSTLVELAVLEPLDELLLVELGAEHAHLCVVF